MHEASLIKGLIRHVESVAKENGGGMIRSVKIKLGPLAHCSAEHFREHFVDWSKGTLAENAALEIEMVDDGDESVGVDGLALESVEVDE
jgi:Zn finger protein HypA/HybF involved in hydrogenase expression